MVLGLMQMEVFCCLIVVGLVKNLIIFGADMSSPVHIDNKKKDIKIIGKGPIQELDDITLTAEKECSINFSDQQNRFYLNLHYSGVNSNFFANVVEIYEFKAKDSEINDNLKKNGSYKYLFDFSIDYDSIDVNDIMDIHKYLMAKNSIE